jgi:dCMP deaminase
MNWDKIYMSMCYLIATKSKDESTKVGSVITTKDNVVLSMGYNGIPRNIEYKENHQIRPEKYHWFEHAERNAIYNAGRIGARLDLAHTIYIPWLPCSDCTRAIIQVGISKIIVHKQGNDIMDNEHWKESHEVSLKMMEETNTELEYYDGDIEGDLTGFFQGNVHKFN